MKIDALPGWGGLDAARWNDLVERSRRPSVFLTWQWQTRWAQSFAADAALELLAVTDAGGALVGLLPLCEVEPGAFRLVGGLDVSDYLDLIAEAGREEEIWQAILAHRAAHPTTWDLHSIASDSPTPALLASLAPAHGLRATAREEERCPVLRLPATWDAYLAGLSGKDRHELTRKMRKLERELPAVAVRSHASPEGWDDALARFLALHRLSKVGKARFMDERMEGFFREATRALAEAGWARLWFLESEGRPVASFLTLEYAGAVGLYNSGFDPARAALAPGIVLLGHVIKDAIDRGITVFDFLRGEEPYKRGFGPSPEPLFHVRVSP